MSSPLQNNIINLQNLLEAVNALPEAGIDLPELNNEGIADDLVTGKELINSSGEIVTGTNPYEKVATDTEVATQADLIAQIQAVVDELPEAGGGSGNNEEINVVIKNSSNNVCSAYNYKENNWIPVTASGVSISCKDAIIIRNDKRLLNLPNGRIYKINGENSTLSIVNPTMSKDKKWTIYFPLGWNGQEPMSIDPKDIDYINLGVAED